MPWKLFYDGGCNLCHSSKLRVAKWAAKRNFPLELEILQSEEGLRKGYGSAMVLETERGVFQAEHAWLEIMLIAPWYLRWVHWLGKVPLIRPALAWGYRVVAKYRYRWFGTRACPVPSSKPPSRV
jgi:predicted DCC family thiol-disulfide oxidoreductase YuxK